MCNLKLQKKKLIRKGWFSSIFISYNFRYNISPYFFHYRSIDVFACNDEDGPAYGYRSCLLILEILVNRCHIFNTIIYMVFIYFSINAYYTSLSRLCTFDWNAEQVTIRHCKFKSIGGNIITLLFFSIQFRFYGAWNTSGVLIS